MDMVPGYPALALAGFVFVLLLIGGVRLNGHRRRIRLRQRVEYLKLRLQVDGTAFSAILFPGDNPPMDATLSVGHKLNLSIEYLDQHGNPMLTTPTPDAPAAWSNTTPAVETLAVAADGNSAVATPVAPGTDAVNLAVTVGGAAFVAALNVTVTPEPQVLTSVAIAAIVA
jgi:hypothetical protein